MIVDPTNRNARLSHRSATNGQNGVQLGAVVAPDTVVGRFNPLHIGSYISGRGCTEMGWMELLAWNEAIVSATGDGLVVYDTQGNIVRINSIALRLLGYTVEDSAIRYPERLERLSLYSEDGNRLSLEDSPPVRAVRGESFQRATVIVRDANGHETWLSMSGSPILAPSGAPLGAVLMMADRTAERKLGEELRQKTQDLEEILDALPDLYFWLDSSGRFLDHKTACLEKLLTSPGSFMGKRVDEVLPPELARRILDVMEQVLSTRTPGILEYSLPTEEGAVFFEARITPFGAHQVLVLARDISNRKLAEAALKESEERFRLLATHSPDMMCHQDTSLRYTWIVGRFATGAEVGKTDFDVLDWEAANYLEEIKRRVLRTGQEAQVELNARFLGTEHYLNCRYRPSMEADGRISGLFGYIRDMTEGRRAAEKLQRAQRLETAGKIAGQVAHDFNNLLGPMIVYPGMIKMGLPEGHPSRTYCDDMESAAQLMAKINEELLVLSRRGLTSTDAVDLNALVMRVVSQIPEGLDRLVVELELSPDLLPALGSAAQLVRLVLNLVNNAREAMSDMGVLRIATQNWYVDRPFGRYNRVEVGEYVKFIVSDTGCGIPLDIQDRIFDAFFTTKKTDRRRGSGLGLSIVQAVVEDHAGYIDLDSKMGEGTTFYVYLPVQRECPVVALEPDLPRGSGRVLVVDDDEFQRRMIQRVGESLGYHVRAVASGPEALLLLRQQPADLLMLDMVMDGMDGVEAYREALKIRPGQRAIMMSGLVQSDRVAEAARLGATVFMHKPMTVEQLAAALQSGLSAAAENGA